VIVGEEEGEESTWVLSRSGSLAKKGKKEEKGVCFFFFLSPAISIWGEKERRGITGGASPGGLAPPSEYGGKEKKREGPNEPVLVTCFGAPEAVEEAGAVHGRIPEGRREENEKPRHSLPNIRQS